MNSATIYGTSFRSIQTDNLIGGSSGEQRSVWMKREATHGSHPLSCYLLVIPNHLKSVSVHGHNLDELGMRTCCKKGNAWVAGQSGHGTSLHVERSYRFGDAKVEESDVASNRTGAYFVAPPEACKGSIDYPAGVFGVLHKLGRSS